MTHVEKEKIRAMLNYKHLESENNSEIILSALYDLSRLVSSTEIEQYIRQNALKKAKDEAERKYSNAEITSSEIDRYIAKNSKTMDLRTIQRWLSKFARTGLVENKNNKYLLSEEGKRHLQFREFTRSYGLVALNHLMNCYFPTLYTLDQNLKKLVEIFGTYVIYCLIEAMRLVTSNKTNNEEHWHSSYFEGASNFRNGKFKEGKFVDSWINDVFSPWHMLNLFLVSISNANKKSVKNKPIDQDEEETILQEYSKHYKGFDLSKISGIPIDSILPTNNKKKENTKIAYSTALDLLFSRVAETSDLSQFAIDHNYKMPLDALIQNKQIYHFLKIRNQYNENHPLYELNSEKIEELKNSLKKQYPLYYKCLRNTDDYFYRK
jgi:hypothetical protein